MRFRESTAKHRERRTKPRGLTLFLKGLTISKSAPGRAAPPYRAELGANRPALANEAPRAIAEESSPLSDRAAESTTMTLTSSPPSLASQYAVSVPARPLPTTTVVPGILHAFEGELLKKISAARTRARKVFPPRVYGTTRGGHLPSIFLDDGSFLPYHHNNLNISSSGHSRIKCLLYSTYIWNTSRSKSNSKMFDSNI